MTNKSRQELNLEYWGDWHKKCKGTALEGKEWLGVKLGWWIFEEHPKFDCLPEHHEIAIAVLEDKPVFVGDKYWLRHVNQWAIAEYFDPISDSACSWTPPTKKRTFMLNGVELPCPVAEYRPFKSLFGHRVFYWDSSHHHELFRNEMVNLLTEARDKE